MAMYRSNASRTRDEDDSQPDGPQTGRVTKITTQRRDSSRVSVFLDDTFAFGLVAELLLETGLHVGQELTAEDTALIRAGDEIRRATSAAVQFLGYRARSEGEIQTRLRKRGFTDVAIVATIAKLRDWHYVDDEEFASRWVENRLQHRPRSARLLSQELRQRGVAPEIANQVITDAEVDEVAGAIELANARAKRLGGVDEATRHRRIAALLARRGYGWEIIRKALANLPADDDPEVIS